MAVGYGLDPAWADGSLWRCLAVAIWPGRAGQEGENYRGRTANEGIRA